MIALVLAAPPLFAQEARPAPGVAVTLSDGSVLVSSGIEDVLQINTPYGEQKIPVRQVRLAKRLPTGSFVVHARGLSITGELAAKEIELNTCIGPVRVATDDLRMISVPNGPGYFQDDSAAALWWFGDSADGTCRDLVRGRPFALQDFERVEDLAGFPAVVGKVQTALATVPSDADLDFGDQDYTMEIRFRVFRQPRQNTMLLQKGNANNGGQDFNVCACTNGVLCIYSARTGMSLQTPQNCFRRDVWNTCTLVQRAQPPSVSLYLNGKLCASGAYTLPHSAGQNLEWTIGSNPRLGAGCEAPEAVQYVRISRKARSAEEIEQIERGWDSPLPQAGSQQGVVLRDGSFLRGELASPSPAAFRTRFGDLKISEKAGLVKLFRMRLPDLEKERSGLPDLIAQLGSAEIKDRETAFHRILSYGEIAVPELKRLGGPSDAEIRSRIDEAIKKLEETGAARRPACDVLQLGGMSVHGWLEMDPIVLNTRRGRVQLAPSKVAEIRFGRRDPRPRPLIRLFSGEVLEFEPAEDSKLAVDTGFGAMVIPAEELKELSFDAARKQWTMITERLTAAGKISGTLGIDTPLGPLAVPVSELKEMKPPAGTPAPQIAVEDR
jgi:hypothetical protein